MSDHSQCGETQWILDNLKPRVGKFVEIGAFDGVQSSNTILLEELGWTGVCVEADPILAAKCSLNRKCHTICAGVSTNYGLKGFRVNPDDRGLSGFSQNWEFGIWVPTIKLMDVMCTIDGCQLLSIDTEGTELDVWSSGGPWLPKIVIMEYQTRDLPSQQADIVNQMTRDGYMLRHVTKYNLIFTRD